MEQKSGLRKTPLTAKNRRLDRRVGELIQSPIRKGYVGFLKRRWRVQSTQPELSTTADGSPWGRCRAKINQKGSGSTAYPVPGETWHNLSVRSGYGDYSNEPLSLPRDYRRVSRAATRRREHGCLLCGLGLAGPRDHRCARWVRDTQRHGWLGSGRSARSYPILPDTP